ncbi:multicopper oxidase family protein [Actinomycetes bacterium KLBMP 9797]
MPPSEFEALVDGYMRYSMLLVLAWGVASVLVARRPRHRSAVRTRIRAAVLLAVLAAGWALIVARLVVTWRTGQYGWLFVADRVLVAHPVVILPALAVLALTVPPIVTTLRVPTVDRRRAMFAPRAVVPVYAVLAGAFVGPITGLVVTLAPPLLRPALVVYGVVALAVTGLWALQARRYRAVASGHPPAGRPWYARILRVAAVVVAVVAGSYGLVAWGMSGSRLPDTLSMGSAAHAAHAGTSVAALAGPRDAVPDRRFTLVAQPTRVRLASGRTIDAWTFNGQAPGPELRVRRGELVEVTVLNRLPDTGVAVHWHGVDVPNAEDGVPGVTQDAIPPGGRHVYRFRPDEEGTRWYHSHQQSSLQVKKGLFGALVIEPPGGPRDGALDVPLLHHHWYPGDPTDLDSAIAAFGVADRLDRRTVAPGTRVRVRLFNTDNMTHPFSVTGSPVRVTAIDGNAVRDPTPFTGRRLVIGAGGRYDVEFVMPDRPVRVTNLRDPDRGVLFSPDGTGTLAAEDPAAEFDPLTYGAPASTPFGPDSRFTQEQTMVLDNELGFYDGKFTFTWTTNGKVFPDVPVVRVREGDLVKLTFANRSHFDHPMHLHGHHVLVLSRGGEPVTGSPLWLDTVNVRVGEVWEVAFRADNPGIWMNHCHILDHAALGMMTHVEYEGVRTPYHVGHGTPNVPE